MNNVSDKQAKIDRIVLISFLVDSSDIVISIIATLLTGSVTMLSQALEGISDLFSSGFLYLGNVRSKKPANKKYPFGFSRETYFWSLMSGLITFAITATLSFYFGWKKFLEPEIIENLPVAIGALVFSMFTNGYSTFVSAQYIYKNRGKKNFVRAFMKSPFIEVKTSFVLDMMGTAASFLGLVALLTYQLTGDLRLDGLGAMVIGVALALFSSLILSGAKELIIGRSAPDATVETIYDTILLFEDVQTIEELKTLILGSNKLLIITEINVKDHLTTDELEILIDKIEKRIQKAISWKASIQIELEAVAEPTQ